MLLTIAVILVILLILGFVSSYTIGVVTYTTLVLAVIVVLIDIFQDRRAISQQKIINQIDNIINNIKVHK